MPLSPELRDVIIQDFLDIFQARYGETWKSKLTANLRPSPIRQIAEQRGATITDVKKVRRQLVALGQVINSLQMILQPIDDIYTPEYLNL
jgi:hypothetical protein